VKKIRKSRRLQRAERKSKAAEKRVAAANKEHEHAMRARDIAVQELLEAEREGHE